VPGEEGADLPELGRGVRVSAAEGLGHDGDEGDVLLAAEVEGAGHLGVVSHGHIPRLYPRHVDEFYENKISESSHPV